MSLSPTAKLISQTNTIRTLQILALFIIVHLQRCCYQVLLQPLLQCLPAKSLSKARVSHSFKRTKPWWLTKHIARARNNETKSTWNNICGQNNVTAAWCQWLHASYHSRLLFTSRGNAINTGAISYLPKENPDVTGPPFCTLNTQMWLFHFDCRFCV